MWLVNLENGKGVCENDMYWTDLDKITKLTGVTLVNSNMPRLSIGLSNYDKYYFAREASSIIGSGEAKILAEIIGGLDESLRIGIEVRMDPSGPVNIRTYPITKFKYSPSILLDGKRSGRPGYVVNVPEDIVPTVETE